MDNEARNIAGLTWTMEAQLREHAVIIGTRGRITLAPAHAPTSIEIVLTPPGETIDGYPGAYHGLYVPVDETVVSYKDLLPGTHGVGKDAGYNFPNSSGFTYQAEAVHRCLAAGLRGQGRHCHFQNMTAMPARSLCKSLRNDRQWQSMTVSAWARPARLPAVHQGGVALRHRHP